jgi:cell wall-associated NlpC family hydrolase
MHKGVTLDNLEAGDVLLCYKAEKTHPERKISRTTGSGYTHAAICIGDGLTAGSSEIGFEVEPFGRSDRLLRPHRRVQTT